MKASVKETIETLKTYRNRYETEAERADNVIDQAFYKGKAEAYELAVFELERNTEF